MAGIVGNRKLLNNDFTPWPRLPNEIKGHIFRVLLDSFTMVQSEVIGWCLGDDPLFRQAYSCAWASRSSTSQIRAVCHDMAKACPPSYCELPGSFSWTLEQAEKSIKWHRLRAVLYYIYILQQGHDQPEKKDVERGGSEGQSVLTSPQHVGGEYFVKVTFPYLVRVRPDPRSQTCVQANLVLFLWLRVREDPAPEDRARDVWLFEFEASLGISLSASMEAEVNDACLRTGLSGFRIGRPAEL